MSEPGDRLPALGSRGQGWVAMQLLALGGALGLAALDALAVTEWWTPLRIAQCSLGGLLASAGTVLGFAAMAPLLPSFTVMPRPREDGVLVRHGVYALVRHPIYGGLTLCCTGASLLAASWRAFAVTAVLFVVLVLKSLREEAWLVRRYESYAAYRASTRRFFPFAW